MHQSVLEWVPSTLSALGVEGTTVLEVGSYDVNGSVRPAIEDLGVASYLGVDQSAGPRVDLVCNATELGGLGEFDVVISTEMLEHVRVWQPVMFSLAAAVKPGGWLALTTRSIGFPYHAYPDDFWRYSLDGLAAIYEALRFDTVSVASDPQCPGVFGIARKPDTWTPPPTGVLDDIRGVTPMPGRGHR
jgi:SAM-dependent methyltransferase